ncbi:DUF3047 domain-containing protein [Alkalimarinus coralli]|uniref:DUF3047 domain-containing protein n=1 Tax=Alkalimarinus coralli TaxID=2935863 RepID=UPI00202B0FA8|nr:DUF3047 domain-containing protein [Alkalimarinus coralli]
MSQTVAYLFICFLLVPGTALSKEQLQKDHIVIGRFSSSELTGWEEKVFDNKTAYFFTKIDDQIVLKSVSNDSASGLFKEVTVDIQKYPYLNWRWRIENKLAPMDESQKAGDDYVARLYVMVSGGLFFWNTKALNYVWSSRSKKGERWPNAFAPDNNRMVAVRTADDQVGTWYSEKRNVYDAFKHEFGEEVRLIDGVAIMTDTDNSNTRATVYYGDIYFSKE